jgi:P pilus assembly chaperone PapD
LSWTAGSGATSHDVYFGTSSPGSFQGNQTATTFDPGTMANSTTYYWRIDEVNAGGTTTGTVWSFTTIVVAPGQASNPSPADSATDVSVDADLSWTAGSGATSHDVYFGTSSPGAFQGNQTATTYDPGTMANDTTYYWRIDEINAAGTTTGNVWSFTTIVSTGNELVGWWKLDESAGTNAADSSGKGYDGTLVGADWAPTSGKFDGAVSFNIVDFNDRVDVPITEMSASVGSISLWGKFPGTRTGIRYFFGHTSIPATGYSDRIQLYMDNDDTQLDLGLGDSHVRHANIMTLSIDTWYHIVLTWDTGDYIVYVDTDVKASGTYTGLNTLASVASIGNDGRQTPDNGAFYGLLDDVRVYNYKLGQDDVNDLFNAGVTPPGQATNPSPADSATDVSIDADLSWTAGAGADSHDVYFGTASPGAFQGNQTETTFDPGTLSYDITYYWRIDEINVAGTTTGNVWSFTTEAAPQPPGQATNPSPADSATDVDVDADLSWTAGSGSTSSDVYFGTTSPGTFQGNQTETTFEPGTMSNDTTYYWRIDEINAAGTTTGNVWTFTTIVAAPGQASNPSPADSATDVDIDEDLSWTAGSGSTSSDVYFGTTSPGTFQGNQTETTFEPGTMSNDTTYYWRIDEINVGGTTTGNVWTFTTIVAAPGQASNPSPADSATDVAVSADLSWTAGSDATSHDVYFGTTSPGTFQGNQTETTFDPGTMSNDTTYYWRIDEINVAGTTTGNVWSFTTVAAGNAFLQDSGADGIVSMEAENYDLYTQQGSHEWISVTTPAGYTGTAAMNTTPNNGTNQDTNYAANSPQLDYQVDFVKTGTHYVWIRGYFGTNGADDSIHAGLDGAEISTCDRISTSSSSYVWTKATWDGPDAWFNVSSTGVHTVNAWMREDGFVFDKIVLTTNVNYTPTGDGPPESPRGGGPTPPGQASSPNPADSATDVSVDADLSWTAGSGSTSSDVYFGTSSPGTFQGNQTETTFDPGIMANDTTYYWRIDEINAAGTTTGVVWSFTTESAPSTLPWTDGFESGDLVTGGWTTSGNASASNKAEYTGTYGAAVKGIAWMEKAISTAGFTTIHVKYVRKTKGLDSGEYLYVEYHDGTQWNELEATQATSWASQDKTCGSSADNNADFKIRFRTNANNASEYAYIDDVEITGTSQ